MSQIIKDGKPLKSRAKPSINPIDWDSLESILKRCADNPNELLSEATLLDIAMVLSNENKHPRTNEPLPVPPWLRDFLSNAFLDLARGKDPSIVLRRKLRGSAKKWSVDDKVMACALVNQLVAQGMEVKSACCDVARETGFSGISLCAALNDCRRLCRLLENCIVYLVHLLMGVSE